MQRHRAGGTWAWAGALAIAVSAVPVGAAAQDAPTEPPAPRFTLAHRGSRGLVTSVERLTIKRLHYELGAAAAGAAEVPADVEHVERSLYTDVVQAAEQGRPTRIERTVHAQTSTTYIRSTDQRTAQRKPLHGRTLLLTHAEDTGWQVTSPTGAPIDVSVAREQQPVPLPALLLPETAVAVGEQWTIPTTALRTLLRDTNGRLEVREATGTLEAVTSAEGRRVARVQIRLAWTAPHEQVMQLDAALAGPLHVDLGANRIMDADLTGTLHIRTRPAAQRAGAPAADVRGDIAMRWRVWSGRPAPDSGGDRRTRDS